MITLQTYVLQSLSFKNTPQRWKFESNWCPVSFFLCFFFTTQALYCSESCRCWAWSSHHRLACQAATDLETAGLSPLEMLSVRVMSRFGADKIIEALPISGGELLDATSRFRSDSVRSFLHTFSNPQCWSFEEMLEKCIKAVLILRAFHLAEHPEAATLGTFLLRSLHGIPLIAHEVSER